MAGVARGSAYITLDIDVAYERSRPNLERIAELSESSKRRFVERPGPTVPPGREDLENGANFTFETRYGALDLLRPGRGATVCDSDTAPASRWMSKASGSASSPSTT